jgi:hypothetical protein
MYVAVVAAMVVGGRRDIHASVSSPEDTATSETRDSMTRVPTSGYPGSISIQETEVVNCTSFYEVGSSHMNRTQEEIAELNRTSGFLCDSLIESDKLAAAENTNDHAKGSSESTRESRNPESISPESRNPELRNPESRNQESRNPQSRNSTDKTNLLSTITGNPYQSRNKDGGSAVIINTHNYQYVQTEFQNTSTPQALISMQDRGQPDERRRLNHKLIQNRRLYEHEGRLDQKILQTSESSSDQGEIRSQRLLKLLINEDDELNKTVEEAWKYIHQFLNSGDLEVGQEAINSTQEYVECRRYWIGYIQLFPFSNNVLPLLADGTGLHARNMELNDTEIVLNKLQDIHRLVKIVRTDVENFRTYSDAQNYSASMSFLFEAEGHLNDMKMAVNDIQRIWEQNSFKSHFSIQWNYSFNLLSDRKTYLEAMNKSIQEEYMQTIEKSDIEEVFQYYIYPGVYLIIFILGTIGNGALLLMFVKHKEVRTGPNIMIFNLALTDVMNLFANAPLYYASKYYSEWIFLDVYGCRIFVTFRFLNHTIIELSIVALSAQRYCAIVTSFDYPPSRMRLSARSRTILYILTVWLIALVLALPPSIIFEFKDGVCFPFVRSQTFVKALDIFYFTFFCFFLPITMGVFSVLTARKLRQSVSNVPGELRYKTREAARYRSARVITALAVTYAISHIPRSVWFFLVSFFHLNRREMKYIFIDEVTNYLIFSNSCLNPLALYIASGTFRGLFRRYLFCVQQNKLSSDPLHRPVTASSSTRLVYFVDPNAADIASSITSLTRQSVNVNNQSDIIVNINPSVHDD